MIVKGFLGYFLVFFPESSMFPFIFIKPLPQLSFDFSNIRSLTTHYISKVIVFSWSYNLKVSLLASVAKVVVVLIDLQSKDVFFPHGPNLLVSLVIVRAGLTR